MIYIVYKRGHCKDQFEITLKHKWGHTCPSDAAATGSGEISEKSASIGNPSSCSIVLKATSVENGAIRSCKSESSSKYEGGIKSCRKKVFQGKFTTSKDVGTC